jgi:aspartate-semialdehyde dehydrogenase
MRIGIVGATGLTGKTLLDILALAPEPVDMVYLTASEASVDQHISFRKQDLKISATSLDLLKESVDVVFFATSTDLSLQWIPVVKERARWIIDLSSAYRMEADVPLLVPGINDHTLDQTGGLIANPNCSTIQLLRALYPIHQEYSIQKIVVATYQSVSGMGQGGLDRMQKEEEGLLFPSEIPLHRNVIPWIGPRTKDELCDEEQKMIEESRKIFSYPSLAVYPTTVRVPVAISHGEAVYVETAKEMQASEVIDRWKHTPDLLYSEDFSYPLQSSGSNMVWLSRLRLPDPRVMQFWCTADNLRVGSAWNAYRILKLLNDRSLI